MGGRRRASTAPDGEFRLRQRAMIALDGEASDIAVEQMGYDIFGAPGARSGGLIPVRAAQASEQGEQLGKQLREEAADEDRLDGFHAATLNAAIMNPVALPGMSKVDNGRERLDG